MTADGTPTSWSTERDAAALLDEMESRTIDLHGAAALGGVGARNASAPDLVEYVPGSPEPPD